MAKQRDKREAGKSFVEAILAKLPEDQRAGVQTSLMRDEIFDFAGEQHLRHDEFSRLSDDLRKQTDAISAYKAQLDGWKGELDGWYASKKADLDEAARLKVRRSADDLADDERPAVDLTGYVKQEDVQKLLNERVRQTEEQGVSLMALTPQLAMRHYIEFKEPLNLFDVIAHAREKDLRLDLAYDDWIKPRVEERQKKDLEDQLKKAREEGALEERKRQFTTPYPITTTEPTTLDGLDSNFKKGNPVEAAVADYYERQRPV